MSANAKAMPDEPSSSDAAEQHTSSVSKLKSRIGRAVILFESLTSLLHRKKKPAPSEIPTLLELDQRSQRRKNRIEELDAVLDRIEEKSKSSGPRRAELQRQYDEGLAELEAIVDEARTDVVGLIVWHKDVNPDLRELVMSTADEETKRRLEAEETAKAQGGKPGGIWAS